jgi:predicted ferric reductase
LTAPLLAIAAGGLPGWLSMASRLAAAEAGWSPVMHHASDVAAMLGTSLFAASLVLMLRVGWLERLFGGLDNLYLSHHLTAIVAFLVLLLHPVALGLAHVAGGDASLALDATAPSLRSPAVLAGWVALLWLMAMMVGTFHVRLSYATWRWLHASSGIAFAIAIAHVLALPPRLRLEHALLAAWVGAAIAALSWRLLIDQAKVNSRRYLVSHVRQLSDDIIEVLLRPVESPLRFAPGQFAFAAFYDYEDYRGCKEYHPFTIASAPDKGELRLIVKALGDCTTRMQSLRPGVLARVQGPFGAFARQASAKQPQVWIAGGIGITPFASLAEDLAPDGPPIDLYYAAATRDDAVCLPEIERAAGRSQRLRVISLFADRGEILSAERIDAQSGPLAGKEFFICGPVEMVQAISSQLRALGVPGDAVHSERFDFR